jgi:O-antigen chain-terminating methyltransferase
MSEDFYRAFEAKFRGSREVIQQRLEVYLPFLRPLQSLYPDGETLDLGCGRGEWLGLMDDLGFNAVGVDLNQAMLDSCLEFRLKGLKGDALEYLANLPNDSQVVISAFHLIEHISFDQLQELVKQALRVLKPGGLLILETPNAENIRVATQYFYLDPTHLKPVPSQQLSFLTEYIGFKRTKVIGLQEEIFADSNSDLLIRKIVNGVSQDYAVIAQKDITQDIYGYSENPFAKIYGVGIDDVIRQYDAAINHKIAVLENEFKHLYNEFEALFSSRSWRLTKPLRHAGTELRHYKNLFLHYLVCAKLALKSAVWRLIKKVKSYPRFYRALKELMKACGIFNLLKSLAGRGHAIRINSPQLSEPWVPSAHLSDRALRDLEKIKSNLNQGIKK